MDCESAPCGASGTKLRFYILRGMNGTTPAQALAAGRRHPELFQGLKPAGGDNAIEAVAFAFHWNVGGDGRPPIDAVNQLLPQLEQLGFKKQEPIQTFTFTIAQGNAAPPISPSQTAQVSGTQFSGLDAMGNLLRRVMLRDNELVIILSKYSRWNAVLDVVNKVTALLFPVLFRHGWTPSSVALQYNDKFTWTGQGSFPVARVLKKSAWVCDRVLEEAGAWHSHLGFFKDEHADVATPRLDNINAAVVWQDGLQHLTIVTTHRTTLRQDNLLKLDEWKTHYPKILETAHTYNKKILKEMLSDDACALIGLI